MPTTSSPTSPRRGGGVAVPRRPRRAWHLPQVAAPVGGYLTVTVPQVAMLWVARREKVIGPLAFRVWWAVLEMRCRRDAAGWGGKGREREPFHGVAELQRLLGLDRGPASMKPLRAAVRQLEAAGLLVWSDLRPQLAVSPDQYRGDTQGVFAFLQGVENKRRLVPVPRRWVRWFAAGQSRARAGAALVSLIRCLYVRDGRLDPNGSWAATAAAPLLGLSGRALQGARRDLVAEGMLRAHPTPPWYQSRYGLRLSVNLGWSGRPPEGPHAGPAGALTAEERPAGGAEEGGGAAAGAPRPGRVSSGRAAGSGRVSSAPLHEHPSSSPKEEEFKHQQPPAGEGDGVQIEREARADRGPRRHGLHLQPRDLRDDELFAGALDRAVRAGKVEPGDRGRLRWWGAREHALRVTAAQGGSPLKLMAWMLHRRRWDLITEADEKGALARRSAQARSRERARPAPPDQVRRPTPSASPAPLSADAKLLASARDTCRRHGQGPEVLRELLRRAAPGWTPERERAAGRELEDTRLERLRRSGSADPGGGQRGEDGGCMVS